jgi:hypothetical protein
MFTPAWQDCLGIEQFKQKGLAVEYQQITNYGDNTFIQYLFIMSEKLLT